MIITLTQSQSLWMTFVLIVYMQILFPEPGTVFFFFFLIWLCGLIYLRFPHNYRQMFG